MVRQLHQCQYRRFINLCLTNSQPRNQYHQKKDPLDHLLQMFTFGTVGSALIHDQPKVSHWHIGLATHQTRVQIMRHGENAQGQGTQSQDNANYKTISTHSQQPMWPSSRYKQN
jgi:hypothetical protein